MYRLNQKKLLNLFLIFVVISAAMVFFQAIKEFFFNADGRLSLWQSHVITIIFSGLVGTAAVYLVQNGSKKRDKEIARRELQSTRFVESLLNDLPIAVFYKDFNGRYLGCNDVFCKTLGKIHQQIVGKTVFDLWPSDKAQIYHQRDLALIQNPGYQEYESKIENNDGKERDVIYSKNVFHDEHGKVAGIVGAFVDITEKNQTERELVQYRDHLSKVVIPSDLTTFT